MNLPRLMLLFICMISSYGIHAQTKTLVGGVYDVNGNPISKASVVVSHNDSVMGIAESNDDGKYSLDGLPAMKVGIYVRSLGFQAKADSVDLCAENIYTAILRDETVELDSVTVYGDRKPIKTPYGHIYILSKKARESGNPYKALEGIPGLWSDYMNEKLTSVDGKSILFLVDGSKVNTGLAAIDPSRIVSVEVIDVVSSKYICTGVERIVNIHTKRPKTFYSYVRLGMSDFLPWKSGWAGPTFEVGNSKLSLYVSLSPSWSRHNKTRGTSTYVTTDYLREYTENEDSRSHSFDYTTMLKWRPTKNDFFILSFQGNDSHSTSFRDDDGYHQNRSDSTAKRYTYHEALSTRSYVYSPTLYYKHDIGKTMSIDGTLRYTYNHSRQVNQGLQTLEADSTPVTMVLETRRRAVSQELDFSWRISKTFGLYAGNATDYAYNQINNESVGDYYKLRTLNEYGYASLSMKLGGLSSVLSAGADYMHLNSAGVKHSYTRPNVSADFSYERGVLTSSLQYRLQNTQPPISRLNPFNTSSDPLQHISGNPMLVPQRTHVMKLSEKLTFKKMQFYESAYYYYSMDMILPCSYYENGIRYTTYSNYGSYHLYTLTGTASFFRNNFRNNFYAAATTQLNGISYPGQKTKYSLGLQGDLIWRYKKFGFNTSVRYLNKTYSPFYETRYHTPFLSQMSISYSLNPNLIFIMGCDNIFGRSRYDNYTHLEGYDAHISSHEVETRVFMTMRWTMRKHTKERIAIDERSIKAHEDNIQL